MTRVDIVEGEDLYCYFPCRHVARMPSGCDIAKPLAACCFADGIAGSTWRTRVQTMPTWKLSFECRPHGRTGLVAEALAGHQLLGRPSGRELERGDHRGWITSPHCH